MLNLKKVVIVRIIIIFTLLSCRFGPLYGQHLLAEDFEKHKIRKVKPGKELSLITKTDTLDYYDMVYNEETQEWQEVWTGYWYLVRIHPEESSIELWNNLDERRVKVDTEDIKILIFKQEDRKLHRQILLGVCFGGIVWAAASENSTQSIAAIGVTLASAGYLAGTVGRTRYRRYKFVGIEE